MPTKRPKPKSEEIKPVFVVEEFNVFADFLNQLIRHSFAGRQRYAVKVVDTREEIAGRSYPGVLKLTAAGPHWGLRYEVKLFKFTCKKGGRRRMYEDALSIKGFQITEGEWTEESIREALSVMDPWMT